MKAYLTKVSLALLSTAFLLGCQEQASSPVGPEGLGPQFAAKKCDTDNTLPGCGGSDGGPAVTTLDLADGMQTTDLDVTVHQDNPKKFNVGNSDFDHDIQMDFTDPGVCVGFAATNSGVAPSPGEVAALEAELSRLVTNGYFQMQIDKRGLEVGGSSTSDRHLLLVDFEGTLGPTRIQLGSPFDQVDPVTVKWVSQDVFEFTGPVVVWAHPAGGEKANRIIACPGEGTAPNKVVATVKR